MDIIGEKRERDKKDKKSLDAEKNKKPKRKRKTPIKVNLIIFHEEYKNTKILNLFKIEEFNSLVHISPPSSSNTLFERKKIAYAFYKQKKYFIEDILEYDDTKKKYKKNI